MKSNYICCYFFWIQFFVFLFVNKFSLKFEEVWIRLCLFWLRVEKGLFYNVGGWFFFLRFFKMIHQICIFMSLNGEINCIVERRERKQYGMFHRHWHWITQEWKKWFYELFLRYLQKFLGSWWVCIFLMWLY